tara:strand:+ start:22 stop:498 length:477 start_codon:yes stop_codon:yes gene_type:complete
MSREEMINELVKEYGLSDHLKKQTPIENGSPEWDKIIEIACDIEVIEVEKNNSSSAHWIEDEKGTTNTEKGTHFYFEIEDEVMSYFNIVDYRDSNDRNMYIEMNKEYKETGEIFDICNQDTKENLKEDYMYMYSDDEGHFFKHIETREYIKINKRLRG